MQDDTARAVGCGSGRARWAAHFLVVRSGYQTAVGTSPRHGAGSSEQSEALVGVTSQPTQRASRCIAEEPEVSQRSKSERPRRQISSRILVSFMNAPVLGDCLRVAARPSRGYKRQKAARNLEGPPHATIPQNRALPSSDWVMGFGMAIRAPRRPRRRPCDVSAEWLKRSWAGGNGASTRQKARKTARHRRQRGRQCLSTETICLAQCVAETLGTARCSFPSATMDPDVARRLAKQLEAQGGIISSRDSPAAAQRAAQGESPYSPPAVRQRRQSPVRRSMRWQPVYELGDDAGRAPAFKMDSTSFGPECTSPAASEAIRVCRQAGPRTSEKVLEVITASAGKSDVRNRMRARLDGDYTPCSAVEIFVKRPRPHPGHGRSPKSSRCRCRRRAADVRDDGRVGMGPRRRRRGGADVARVTGKHLPANKN